MAMKLELGQGESIINSWTLVYTPPTGGVYNGKLTVTNKRLIYDAKFDVSAQGIVDEVLYVKSGSEAYIVIPKEKIKSVEAKKSFFSKKAILTLDNGQQHVFSYGMLNIDPVVNAINQQ